jgi:carbamoyltransferase
MRVLGILAFYHDSAAAIVEEGRVVAPAQEERFTRKKFDASCPHRAVEYRLEAARCSLRDVDIITFYDEPFLKFERLIETYLAFSPRGFQSFRLAIPLWLREKLFLKSLLREPGPRAETGLPRKIRSRLIPWSRVIVIRRLLQSPT